MSKIAKVERSSPLLGKVQLGDDLTAINGSRILDVLDYKYYAYDPVLTLSLTRPAGDSYTLRVKKGEGEDLGLEFESYLMDRTRSCANHCLFCFIDQLPKGLRSTLYFKDDDARLSFLTGSYITLTNLTERELQRIIDLRISPINVSVHAADPALRAYMLGNPKAAAGMERVRRLAEGGITMNCQIVCCPGINDGAVLAQSMEELSALYPQVNSVSIVPVGLTAHREGLAQLTPFDADSARATLAQVTAFGEACLARYGSRIFFCSDELYLKAGLPMPGDEYYEDYPQLENGVGLLRLMETEFTEAMEADTAPAAPAPFSTATGLGAYAFLGTLVDGAMARCGGTCYRYGIVNDFFGHTIDVAGLVTGGDLIAQLRGKPLGERLLIPRNMVRHEGPAFLDDVTVRQAEEALGVPVRIVEQDGHDLYRAVMGR